MRATSTSNEYQESLGRLFDEIPKAVLAALAVSFVQQLEDTPEPESIRAILLAEWQILHENGIVPQRPPRKRP